MCDSSSCEELPYSFLRFAVGNATEEFRMVH